MPNSATLNVTFQSGQGTCKAILMRDGNEIETVNLDNGGNHVFPDVQVGDTIHVQGVATGAGGVDIDISRTTNPATPENRPTGVYARGYDVTA